MENLKDQTKNKINKISGGIQLSPEITLGSAYLTPI